MLSCKDWDTIRIRRCCHTTPLYAVVRPRLPKGQIDPIEPGFQCARSLAVPSSCLSKGQYQGLMSRRQHHDKPPHSSNLSPQRVRSDQEMAASEVQSPPSSRAFSLPGQQADAPPTRSARQSGGAVPLSSLIHDTHLEDHLRTAEPTGDGGYRPSRTGETPVSSADETEHMSPTRRAYFDAVRDAGHPYPRPSVRHTPANPQTPR
jgi:hypothetical protein